MATAPAGAAIDEPPAVGELDSRGHPVWSMYDRLRSARLSVKYYCWRLQHVERANFWLEFVLLASAPGSAIAGLWFWDTSGGEAAWKGLGVIAAFVAVIKPLLHLTKRIKDYESLVAGYRVLEYDLMELKTAVEHKRRYDAALQADFRKIVQRERALINKNPDSRESPRIKRLCREEVNRELPASAFFVPAD